MEDVISLGVGEPDFNTPWTIRKSAIQVLERKHIIYGPNKGIAPLRNTISAHIEKKHGVKYDPDKEDTCYFECSLLDYVCNFVY